MQLRIHTEDGKSYDCGIPDPDVELMPNVIWGDVARLFTPAYWRFTCITNQSLSDTSRYKLGDTLLEEIVACLLGGHGMVAETGLAAFYSLKQQGVIQASDVTADHIEDLLSRPLSYNGSTVRYRYPRQKARYISAALNFVRRNAPPQSNGKELRDWLTLIPGIGLKTGSWIARNWLDACDVAIVDVHVHRAGVIAGFFEPNDNVSRCYRSMETRFIDFAESISVPANILDNQIWNQLRRVPSIVRDLLTQRGVTSIDRCGLPLSNKRRTRRNYRVSIAT